MPRRFVYCLYNNRMDVVNIFLKILFITVHLFVIGVSAIVLLCVEDIYMILLLLITQIIVFKLLLINDGCLLSKYEFIGGKITLFEIAKKVFFLSDSIKTQDFEKIFVGIPIVMLLTKLLIILVVYPFISSKSYTKNSYWCIPKMTNIYNPKPILSCINKEINLY